MNGGGFCVDCLSVAVPIRGARCRTCRTTFLGRHGSVTPPVAAPAPPARHQATPRRTGSTPVICDGCRKTYESPASLKLHHSKERCLKDPIRNSTGVSVNYAIKLGGLVRYAGTLRHELDLDRKPGTFTYVHRDGTELVIDPWDPSHLEGVLR